MPKPPSLANLKAKLSSKLKTCDLNRASSSSSQSVYFPEKSEHQNGTPERKHSAWMSEHLHEKLIEFKADDSLQSSNSDVARPWPICASKLSLDSIRDKIKLNLNTAHEKLDVHHAPKYTPLEQQFLEVKKQYPGVVLFVECGYKFRFFGEDAEIASKELNITSYIDHNFLTACIPNHRLLVHAKRLVTKGYKVGVIHQTETAAVKAAGETRNLPFSRELTALYTRSTFITPDVKSLEGIEEDAENDGDVNTFLLAVWEVPSAKGKSTMSIGIMAVQPSTGEVIFDHFFDLKPRDELSTRLVHIQPVEVLYSESALSEDTLRCIKSYVNMRCNSHDCIRLEQCDPKCFEYRRCMDSLSDFYHGDVDMLQLIMSFVPELISCHGALLSYLKDFHLEKALKAYQNFQRWTSMQEHMNLSACTVRNLDIFLCDSTGKEEGSVYHFLRKTRTKFGARLLFKWLSRPLCNIQRIEERQSMIADFIDADNKILSFFQECLSHLPDLEKALTHALYGRCSPSDFHTMCFALYRISLAFECRWTVMESDLSSPALKGLCQGIMDHLKNVQTYLTAINEVAAKDNNKTQLFADTSCFPGVNLHQQEIASITKKLESAKGEIHKQLCISNFEYVTVSGQEYLIEVRNVDLHRVPDSWVRINLTKACVRFRTPFVEMMYARLCQHRELLAAECEKVWMEFLKQFAEKEFVSYRRAVELIATLDVVLTLSGIARSNDYTRPLFIESGRLIHIEGGWHPVLSGLVETFICNDTQMDGDGRRSMVITGPNMGGKSCYLHQVALIAILAQIGSFVPAKLATLGILDGIYTRMGAQDRILEGQSTFMVELSETSEVLRRATPRSLVVLDELGRGTSTHDGVAIACATLRYLVETVQCLTLFVTHYPAVVEMESHLRKHVGNFHMSFVIGSLFSDTVDLLEDVPDDSITFLYQLTPGSAQSSYGLNVARLAGIESSIISSARRRSTALQKQALVHRDAITFFRSVWSANEPGQLKNVLSLD
ncbi:unnamed protein product [Darwinula stevensoni]|uniref:DNA mismatch repair protein MSH3 n=1 Tax=Darwinula stevensoni TaxID=69355 RepID=A0A7R9A581_9CRUS|nr:unnamed protein product [Darwinula stevensoni]CAG0885883.1 unnamed protein product [Darwinula stevensoni]